MGEGDPKAWEAKAEADAIEEWNKRHNDSNAKALEIASLRRRSPLTQDAILDMAEGCTLEFHSLLAFARAVERAHGIDA